MARVKVQLRGALSYTSIFDKERPWKRNEMRFYADPVKVGYYRQQAEFVCTDVDDSAGPVSAAAEEPYRHTYATLTRLTKAELVAYASMTHGLELDEDSRKDDLIAAILDAQG